MTSTLSPHLLSPFNMGDLSLKNRVVMAPLTRARAGIERMPNALIAEHYRQRASAGLIISEAVAISTQALGWERSPGIYTDAQAEAWKQVVETVHSQGTPIFFQPWHCGRASHSSFHPEEGLSVAPSAIPINYPYIDTPIGPQDHETPRPLETEEIGQVVEDYRQAAIRAKAAGFDGIEVDGSNGYLIDQFLQSKTNHRRDRYGGSLENRFRLLREVLEATISVFPANRVGVRISPNGSFNDMGSPDYRETFLYVAKQLNPYGLAYLHVIDGLGIGFHELGEPMTLAELRQVFDGPLMGNCGYTQETAETAIREGNADLIAFGRLYMSNPDLVERFANGWDLNPLPDKSIWYSPGEKGYTDFPTYREAETT
ncbi:alkene reductase [Baaleninema simplex]|uniref:alkene reductase n=1 Tax=Baaleninema simplex TaxID=2862350 RepID=UPI000347D35A|nr:alkene reductase [Baaleninema simplex]